MERHFYIIATPIGNLDDMTYRAVNVLKDVDTILCEDTRVTQRLLDHYTIATPTQSYHAQSSKHKENTIIQRIASGTTFALVSDAGTPTISDPGVKLIARIRSELPEVTLIPIPGASALVTALCTTGFSGNQFTFYGFLPHKKGRSKIFDTIEVAEHVAVFYESPHRLMKTLAELSKRLGGDRTIGVARELTKIYEEIVINTAENVHQYFLDNPDHVRGEFVILVNTTSS